MKPLIAVMTCWNNAAAAEAIRKTWAKPSSIPVRFFLGESRQKNPQPRPDEIILPCSDSYEALVTKVKLAFQWARNQGFTDVLKCDDDVYIATERLKDVIGRSAHVGREAISRRHPKPFLHGGAGYVINKQALDILCTAPINDVSEDAWATDSLNKVGVKSVSDPRFSYVKRVFGDEMPLVPRPDNNLITAAELHTLAGGRSEFYQVHRKFLEGAAA